MKIGYKTLKVMLETAIDRTESKLDRVIHKPFNSRVLITSPTEFILKLSNQAKLDKSEVLVESFLNSIRSKKVLEQIDCELQKNLPNFRYETIRNFKNSKDWISILESIYNIPS